jgi:hypothetical protein
MPDCPLLPIGFVVLIPAVAGCGYYFGAEGSGLPPQAKIIYVEKFANHSPDTGLEDQFDWHMKDEIA